MMRDPDQLFENLKHHICEVFIKFKTPENLFNLFFERNIIEHSPNDGRNINIDLLNKNIVPSSFLDDTDRMELNNSIIANFSMFSAFDFFKHFVFQATVRLFIGSIHGSFASWLDTKQKLRPIIKYTYLFIGSVCLSFIEYTLLGVRDINGWSNIFWFLTDNKVNIVGHILQISIAEVGLYYSTMQIPWLGNKLRELYSISVQRTLSLKESIKRSTLFVIYDYVIWDFLKNKLLILTQHFYLISFFELHSKQTLFKFCLSTKEKNTIIMKGSQSYLSEVVLILARFSGALIGRTALSLLFQKLQKSGKIFDLRTPFYKNKKQAKHLILIERIKATILIEKNHNTKTEHTTTNKHEYTILRPYDYHNAGYTAPSITFRRKTKQKHSVINEEEKHTDTLEEKISPPLIIITGDNIKFIKIDGMVNCWGIITCANLYSKQEQSAFIEALSNGRRSVNITQNSDNKVFELKPIGKSGDRLLGIIEKNITLEHLYEKLTALIPTGNAREIEEILRASGENHINFVNFSVLAKHDNINKEIQKLCR